MAKIQRGGGQPPQNQTEPPLAAPAANPAPPKTPQPPAPPLIGEPTGFYDQDHDEAYAARAAAKTKAAQKQKRRKKSDTLYTLALVVCAVVFLVSGGMLLKRYFDDQKSESEFSALAALVDDTAAPAQSSAASDDTPSNAAKFAALQAQNPDFFGWLSIAGTNLDYPVMYAPDNKDFYLRHDFEGTYSVYGVPYLDEKTVADTALESQNLIVYGHNMKTGTIFGCLTGYKNADYYTKHPQITFDTLYGDAEYEVFAAFSMDVVTDQSFVYNEYVNVDEAGYNAFVDEVLARSDVNTGIRPTYGEQLLTLSTCEYSTDNGRYVVVGRRLPN